MDITKVELPTKDDLAELTKEALRDGELSHEDYVANHCEGLYKALQLNPGMYRAYGAYWWAVKRILNENGHGEFFGSDVEEITADHFSLEDDVTTLCAAWYYWNSNIEAGYMFNPIHVYSYEEDGDFVQFEYSLEDEDMEAKVVNS
ncbi:TPA: hypothetical protein L3N15_004196 [Vibrio parahaemolyticus]|nr:hypothetical protein [Vibrio parahaemolyticus]